MTGRLLSAVSGETSKGGFGKEWRGSWRRCAACVP